MAAATNPESVYRQRLPDPAAYPSEAAYGDGMTNAMSVLQVAIDRVKVGRKADGRVSC